MAAAGLESVVNRLLELDADLAEGLSELEGSVLELRLQGVDWRFQLRAAGARVTVAALDQSGAPHVATPDVIVRGPPLTLVRMLASAGSIDGVLPTDVSISGDVTLVEKLSALARRAQFDWEEPLARVLGDSLGHEVARGVRGFGSWMRAAADTLALDAGEYLREERRIAANRLEVEALTNDVEILRDDVERLEARVARLVGKNREVRR